MKSKLNPYMNFEGNTREVMEFYKTVFGGELDITTFGETGTAEDVADPDKVMHAQLVADNGITIMAADSVTGLRKFVAGTDMSMSLSGDNEEELTGYYNKLAKGGKVELELGRASWGDMFGMCIDKFGVFWMVNIAGPNAKRVGDPK
ncbi:MAG: VOC family protein [Candidatus Saccharibacteria bacterium]